MSSGKPIFWWRLSLIFHPYLEDSLLWKLDELGIKRVAIECPPECVDQCTLFVWVPFCEFSAIERDFLIASFKNLAENIGLCIADFAWEKVANEDWSKSWKQYWCPDPIGDKLLILPAWLDVPAEYSQRLILRLDPGAAFGTGSHPTTRLCLEALEKKSLENLKVADVGCGSGILSLAALSLGAKAVCAVDIDSLAIRATIENMHLNGITEPTFSAFVGSTEVLLSRFNGGEVADLLVCNILAPVIEELAPSFDSLVSLQGSAFLSGLLVTQVAQMKDLLEALHWNVVAYMEKDQWALLEIMRLESNEERKIHQKAK